MDLIMLTFAGMAFILWGIILLIKSKLMVSQVFITILNLFVSVAFIPNLENMIQPLGIVLLIFSLSILNFLINNGKYIIYGVEDNLISDILSDIFRDEEICYEEEEYFLQLKDYDDKCIFYKQSSSSVEIDLKDIRSLHIYEAIKDDIKIKIEEIDSKIFPKSAIRYILSGIGLIVFVQFLQKIIIN